MDCRYKLGKAIHFYRPQRSCGQGNIFTPVCHSVHGGGGGSASVHAGIPTPQTRPPPGADTPWTRPPPPPRTRPPLDQTPLGADSPPGADTPREQTPLKKKTQGQTALPPGKQTPAYSLRAAGTHPTGMHSCDILICSQMTMHWGIIQTVFGKYYTK